MTGQTHLHIRNSYEITLLSVALITEILHSVRVKKSSIKRGRTHFTASHCAKNKMPVE